MQEPGQNGIQSTVGQRRVHQQQPAILSDQAAGQRRHVTVFFILRDAFETGQDGLETGIVGASQRDAPQGFDEGRKQGGGFGSFLRVQRFHCATTQVFRQLIRPERLE